MDMKTAMKTALLRVAHKAREHVIDEMPYRTGDLKKSATVVERGDSEVAVTAGGDFAPYAKYVHGGTKAHVIRPKNKKALAFSVGAKNVSPLRKGKGKGQSNIVFAREVHHPGTKPNRFMLRAAARTVNDVDAIAGPIVGQAAAEQIKSALRNVKIEVKL